MMTFCQSDPWEQISIKFESRLKKILSENVLWKCHLQNTGHLCRLQCVNVFSAAKILKRTFSWHYNDVIMSTMSSKITSLTIGNSTVCSRCRSKKTSKLSVTGLCEGNSLGTGEVPALRASNVENVSIWWCHHGKGMDHYMTWQYRPVSVIYTFTSI